MPEQTSRQRSNTAEEILDAAEFLIQTRGYSAISYQDIASKIGLRKASIHYHFPTKTSLGVATVKRYSDRFGQALQVIASDETSSSMTMLDQFTVPYLEFADTPDRICLCGALAGEILALPPEVRACVVQNFVTQHSWLTKVLKRGLASGEFSFASSPVKMARTMLSALQGGLLIKRATGNAAQLHDVIAILKAQLISN